MSAAFPKRDTQSCIKHRMYQVIDLTHWYRKDTYRFFLPYEDPYFNITTNIEVTTRYQQCKEEESPFFLNLLFDMLVVVNQIDAFRLRIVEGELRLYETIHTGSTVLQPDNTFNFCYFDFQEDRATFIATGKERLAQLKSQKPVNAKDYFYNTIHSSVVPWIRFTSVKHARKDSKGTNGIPKITFGKYFEEGDKKMLPVSVAAHHSLMDGYHAGLFFTQLEEQMMKKL